MLILVLVDGSKNRFAKVLPRHISEYFAGLSEIDIAVLMSSSISPVLRFKISIKLFIILPL